MSGAIGGLLASYRPGAAQNVFIFSTGGAGSLTAPQGYTKVTVEAVGGGGPGFGSTGPTRAGGGGAAYAKTANLSITGGSTVIYYNVGTGLSLIHI